MNAQYEPQITDDGVASSMVARGPAAVAFGGEVAGTLDASYYKGCGNRTSGPVDVATSCLANGSPHGRMDFASETFVVGEPTGVFPCVDANIDSKWGSNQWVDGGQYVLQGDALAVRTAQTSANGHGVAEEVAHTLDQVQGQAVAFQDRQSIGFNWQNGGGYGAANDGLGITEEGTGPLSRSQVPACVTGQRTHALTTRAAAVEEDGTGRGTTIIPAVYTKAKRAQSENDDEPWVPGEVAPTQNQFDVGDTRATTVVAFQKSDNDGAFAFSHSADANSHGIACVADGSPPIRGGGGGNSMPAVCRPSAMQVRRLTPTECCRLQGFPDDHCDIVYRTKPAADGPKYRALGNSMAVPCMAWLGWRIQKATGGANS